MRSRRSKSGGSGELALIRRIRERAGQSGGELRLGIGDDCALLRPRAGEELAVTTDLTLAGRHFRLDWHPPEAVGHRTLARGLSDLAAMGARPVAAFLSLGLPRELVRAVKGRSRARTPARTWVDGFLDGFLALAEATGTPLAGGDLAESPVFAADIVLIGAVRRGKALLRSGARAGDVLYVTGALGGAAAGLAALGKLARRGGGKRQEAGMRLVVSHPFGQKMPKGWGTGLQRNTKNPPGWNAEGPPVSGADGLKLAAHLWPQPRLKQGRWLASRGLASAALDISDGLSSDLAHLCEESGVAAEVEAAALPVAAGASLEQALHGGEDYELLFAARAAARVPAKIAGVPVTRVGRVVRRRAGKPMITLVTAGGREPLAARGWEHFA